MPSTEVLVLTAAAVVLVPFVLVIALLVLATSFGWTTGFRKKYIQFLLWLFEYGRQKIEKAEQDKLFRTNSKENTCEQSVLEEREAKEVSTHVSDLTELANGGSPLIDRDELVLSPDPNHNHRNGRPISEGKYGLPRNRSVESFKRNFRLGDVLDYVKSGTEAIIEDEVTQRFVAAELRSWNLLTRTNNRYEFLSVRLTIIWMMGFLFRYCILLPSRVFICFIGIGQRHGGFLGIIQRALARASSHIWFERAEAKDREAVARRLREHVEDPDKLPILIFPEGTCINNTSVMQFKKGSFEVGGTIYPVAIKYDARFGDAFWNSSRYTMIQHLYSMMTSWAIVCDVWYLPPMTRAETESAIEFANRVKAAIARQGGLVDLMWDGQLKRSKPKAEWKQKQQEEFSKRLKVN